MLNYIEFEREIKYYDDNNTLDENDIKELYDMYKHLKVELHTNVDLAQLVSDYINM